MSTSNTEIHVQRLPDLDTWELYQLRAADGREAGVVGLRFHQDSMQVEYAIWERREDEDPSFTQILELDAGHLMDPGYAAMCLQRATEELRNLDEPTAE